MEQCYECPACVDCDAFDLFDWVELENCKEGKLKYIARYYGIEDRSILLIEELSELTKAITKWNRVKQGGKSLSVKIDEATARDNIVEEMADVLIMIKQVQMLLGILDIEIEMARNKKIARTMELIGGQGNGQRC
jgi:NTP pyrophosphatase (non-canonical NTP hydrolase)